MVPNNFEVYLVKKAFAHHELSKLAPGSSSIFYKYCRIVGFQNLKVVIQYLLLLILFYSYAYFCSMKRPEVLLSEVSFLS